MALAPGCSTKILWNGFKKKRSTSQTFIGINRIDRMTRFSGNSVDVGRRFITTKPLHIFGATYMETPSSLSRSQHPLLPITKDHENSLANSNSRNDPRFTTRPPLAATSISSVLLFYIYLYMYICDIRYMHTCVLKKRGKMDCLSRWNNLKRSTRISPVPGVPFCPALAESRGSSRAHRREFIGGTGE